MRTAHQCVADDGIVASMRILCCVALLVLYYDCIDEFRIDVIGSSDKTDKSTADREIIPRNCVHHSAIGIEYHNWNSENPRARDRKMCATFVKPKLVKSMFAPNMVMQVRIFTHETCRSSICDAEQNYENMCEFGQYNILYWFRSNIDADLQ